VEKLQAVSDTDMAAGMEQAMKSGRVSLTDLRKQLAMMQRMAKGSGGLGGLLGMLPGMGALQGKLPEGSDKKLLHQMAMIDSMTKQERANPDLLNARRKIRIAKGAGVRVEDVNKLLKAHTQMNDMMKKMSKLGPAGLMAMMKGK
jgi:signal recognition particle subunit SRP54